MSWECCNLRGECQQGPGCPAGGACHGQAGCADTNCPGHPGRGHARNGGASIDLSRVQLVAGPQRRAHRSIGADLLMALAKVVAAALALIGLLCLGTLATGAVPTDFQQTHKKVTT
jgi:hypothetical protein